MGERLGGQHLEVQVQKPFDPEIATFCDQFTSINTRRSYRRDLDAFFHFATATEDGVGELGQLTVGHIDEYLRNRREKGLSSATIKRCTASLSSFLTQAGMRGFAKTVRKISTEHIGSKPEMQPLHPLSAEEVKKLQRVSRNNPRASAIIAIALGTGATLEELRALNVSDVLEQESQIVAIRFRGKGSERQATLDINASESVRGNKGERKGENPLFAQKQPIKRGEGRLSRGSISSDVKQYAKKIERPDLSLTVLRQTFIVNVPTNDSKELARLLGIGERYARALLKPRLTQQLPESGVLFEATTK